MRPLLALLCVLVASPARADDDDFRRVKTPPPAAVDGADSLGQATASEKPACSDALDPAAPPGDDTAPAAGDFAERIQSRDYPSVFQAWTPADGMDAGESLRRHDVVIAGLGSFLQGNSKYPGLSTAYSPKPGKAALRQGAPASIVLAEIRHRDAAEGHLPADHCWWKRDASGERVPADKTGVTGTWFLLDLSNAGLRAQLARQCRAAIASGLFDGCMLDWWATEDADKLALVQAVREAIGDSGLIIVNANSTRPEGSAQYINGIYMEGIRGGKMSWARAQANLEWAEETVREPRINALEAWGNETDEKAMRMATALVLTRSDGSVLYSLPDRKGGPDHAHSWHVFWDKGLGKPLGPAAALGSAFRREFEHGTVVYNPLGGDPVKAKFDEDRSSRATGKSAAEHVVAPGDGDIFTASAP